MKIKNTISCTVQPYNFVTLKFTVVSCIACIIKNMIPQQKIILYSTWVIGCLLSSSL